MNSKSTKFTFGILKSSCILKQEEMKNTLLILLIFLYNFVFGGWTNCRDNEKCFNCGYLQQDLLEVIEVKNRTVVNIISELGTSGTTEKQKMYLARNHDHFHKEFAETFNLGSDVEFVLPFVGSIQSKTTRWVVDEPGAAFATLRARCKFGCKRLKMLESCGERDSDCQVHQTISAIGKYLFPLQEKVCDDPEDYYMYLDVEINNETDPRRVSQRRPPYGITRTSLRSLWPQPRSSLKFNSTELDKLRRSKLIEKFTGTLNPSPVTGRTWTDDFPEFGRYEHDSPSDIYINGGNAAQFYTLIGVCGDYKVETGYLLTRVFNMSSNPPECINFIGRQRGTIDDCDFCSDKKCIKGKLPPF